MKAGFLSLPDDWLALAWCLVSMAACLFLIQAAASTRPRPTRRKVVPAKRVAGKPRLTHSDLDRSPSSTHTVEPYVAAYRLRFSNSHLPVHVPRTPRRPRFGR
jgi:hypothetical protein